MHFDDKFMIFRVLKFLKVRQIATYCKLVKWEIRPPSGLNCIDRFMAIKHSSHCNYVE